MKRNSYISPKIIERLSLYRRYLAEQIADENGYISSKQLAAYSGGSSVQVRQDLRVLGYTGSSPDGYHVPRLLLSIDKLFTPSFQQKAVLAGVGNLGTALLSHFSGREAYPNIIALVDIDPELIGTVICGCRCFHPEEIGEVIEEQAITMGILTLPVEAAQTITDLLIEAGIRGIVNFTPTSVITPESIYVERVDLGISLEKAAYFTAYFIEEQQLEM